MTGWSRDIAEEVVTLRRPFSGRSWAGGVVGGGGALPFRVIILGSSSLPSLLFPSPLSRVEIFFFFLLRFFSFSRFFSVVACTFFSFSSCFLHLFLLLFYSVVIWFLFLLSLLPFSPLLVSWFIFSSPSLSALILFLLLLLLIRTTLSTIPYLLPSFSSYSFKNHNHTHRVKKRRRRKGERNGESAENSPPLHVFLSRIPKGDGNLLRLSALLSFASLALRSPCLPVLMTHTIANRQINRKW